MTERDDEVAENLRKANVPKKDPQEFTLPNELVRGAIYSGGQSQQDIMTSYAWGWILIIGLAVTGADRKLLARCSLMGVA